MPINNDYYGDKIKWFVGVVKDTNDPDGRVRVRIHGIHPMAGDDDIGASSPGSGSDGGRTPSTGGGSTPSSSGGGSTPSSGGGGSSGKGIIRPDKGSLPNNRQLNVKISEYLTLAQVTTGAALSGKKCQMCINELTDEIIYNLALVAKNCMDPVIKGLGMPTITSGWRPPRFDTGAANHRQGKAIDFQYGHDRASNDRVRAWIRAHGVPSVILPADPAHYNHVHVQAVR
jgi:hypothetical protein